MSECTFLPRGNSGMRCYASCRSCIKMSKCWNSYRMYETLFFFTAALLVGLCLGSIKYIRMLRYLRFGRFRKIVAAIVVCILIHLFARFVSDRYFTKVILLHTRYYDGPWRLPKDRNLFHDLHCPVTNCKLTEDPSQLSRADAVVFHAPDLVNSHNMIEKVAGQHWIFLTIEPPDQLRSLQAYRSLLDQIDWTSTYSSESDIRIVYGKFNTGDPSKVQYSFKADQKTRILSQIVDECNAPNHRDLYLHTLTAQLGADKVRVFGKCGDGLCTDMTPVQCLEMVIRNYRFYLAFERTNCREYISEQFWKNALESNMVPVVMGGRRLDYEHYAPPQSFIYAGDFNTTKEFSEFLLKLNKDPDRYQQYFDWQALGTASTLIHGKNISRNKYWCDLCEAINDPQEARKPRARTRPIWQWWTVERQCDNKFVWYDLQTKIKDSDI